MFGIGLGFVDGDLGLPDDDKRRVKRSAERRVTERQQTIASLRL